MPHNGKSTTVVLYALLLFTGGLMKSWSAPALNNPVMAEIVPAHCRNLIFAFDRCFEGADLPSEHIILRVPNETHIFDFYSFIEFYSLTENIPRVLASEISWASCTFLAT